MGLQYPGTHHGEPVQPDLWHEHDQQCGHGHCAALACRLGERGPVEGSTKQRSHRGRSQDDHRPGQQRGRGLHRLGATLSSHVPRHDRNDDPSQHSARDDLEQYVRERVRRVVDVAQAGVAHGLGEHQPASEPEGPGNQGDSGHAQGDRAEA